MLLNTYHLFKVTCGEFIIGAYGVNNMEQTQWLF